MTAAVTGFRRILVATDFSPYADAALHQAVWLARQTGASITLAHALPDLHRAVHSVSTRAKLDILYGNGNAFHREVRAKSDAKMRQMIANLGASDLDVKCETLLGEPFVELTHAVQAEGYDLVLAGTRGLAAWEQFFIGSTAKRLIRKCPASVWITKAEHIGPPKVVLAPIDFSEVSLQSAAYGLWVAQQAGSPFHLLHVIDSTDVPEDAISMIPEGESLKKQIHDEAMARIEAFLDSLHANRSTAQVQLSWGTPWKEIQRHSLQLAADLIVMGTVGRSGIKGLLLGNTAEKALDACQCSVLTVKPDEFVSPIDPPFWPLHPET